MNKKLYIIRKPTIKKIAKITREELSNFISNRFPSDWGGSCAICSWQLTRVLNYFGYNSTFTIGKFVTNKYKAEHAFVTLNNNLIIDITATQFFLGDIVITKLFNNKKYIIEKLNKKAIYDLRKWPIDQNPSTHKKYLDKCFKNTVNRLSN